VSFCPMSFPSVILLSFILMSKSLCLMSFYCHSAQCLIAECHYHSAYKFDSVENCITTCHFAQCHSACGILISAVVPSVSLLNVVALSPQQQPLWVAGFNRQTKLKLFFKYIFNFSDPGRQITFHSYQELAGCVVRGPTEERTKLIFQIVPKDSANKVSPGQGVNPW
jgi:hypothetical protein